MVYEEEGEDRHRRGPVAMWASIRLFIIFALIQGWHIRQFDFVLAYTQADVETDLYMEIP